MMAYTVEEFIRLDLNRSDGEEHVGCSKCKADLREFITGYRCSSGEPLCSDCYFDELSKLVEARLVGIPALRR